MNPPDVFSTLFDYCLITADDLYAQNIPFPSPPSLYPPLNEPIRVEDIAAIKAYLKNTSHSNATGVDLTTYDCIMSIANDSLLPLFSSAIEDSEIPSSWLISIIIALSKPGRVTVQTTMRLFFGQSSTKQSLVVNLYTPPSLISPTPSHPPIKMVFGINWLTPA
ncbi:hypothetical protein EV361DRAFT_955868 [Lentinula raphanica]|nr:hypothetical protein EV361DRAFT_955868 [Lentinula raphanica]